MGRRAGLGRSLTVTATQVGCELVGANLALWRRDIRELVRQPIAVVHLFLDIFAFLACVHGRFAVLLNRILSSLYTLITHRLRAANDAAAAPARGMQPARW